tara:strand:+ start:263 stop:391 length:129 start_codon:yes stop_codon:yes gene_type:complete
LEDIYYPIHSLLLIFDGDFDEHGILMKKAVGVTYMWRPLAGC